MRHAIGVFISGFLLLGAQNAIAQERQLPEWAKDAIWYQIFPERFRNGDVDNDPTVQSVWLPEKRPWHMSSWGTDWYALQEWERLPGRGFYDVVFDRRYGGDLAGIIEKLDYLQSLGITAIYLNPVFESPSLHKYDASTYHHIDMHFGPDPEGDRLALRGETNDPSSWVWTSADRQFLTLITEAHRRDIRVIIDGVFNHCGIRFWAFEDVRTHQQDSPYAGWFDVQAWDDPATPEDEFDYKAWWGFKLHPEFREDEEGFAPSLREYFYAITRRWMDPNSDGDPEDGIDGWRLDVANDVSPVFWRQWRTVVKDINPDAYLVGEIWDNAAEWLTGDQFDAVMNYRFARALVRFFIDTNERRYSVTQFDEELARIRESYPEEVNFVLQNLIDSHDTDRLASMVVNPNRVYDEMASPRHNPDYLVRRPTAAEQQKQRLAILFQMTSLGAPVLYYGDEAGMWGADDPDNRKPMVWPDYAYADEASHPIVGRSRIPDGVAFDSSMYQTYRELIHLRRRYAALRRGEFTPLIRDDDREIYAFQRTIADERVLVVINNGNDEQRVSLPARGTWKRLWKTGTVACTDSDKFTVLMERKTGLVLINSAEDDSLRPIPRGLLK